jgi:hypothetical protein
MASYPMPGYLEHPADLAGHMLSGFHAGAAVAEQQAQLQSQSERTQLELQMRQQEMEKQTERQKQMLEMTRAYHEQQTGLKKAALDQLQQRVQLQTQAAAHKFQAQQQYDQHAQDLINQGVPENEAYGKAAMKFGPAMGMASAPIAAAMRGARDMNVEGAPAPGGLPGTVLHGGNRWQYVPDKVAKAPAMTPSQLVGLAKAVPQLRAYGLSKEAGSNIISQVTQLANKPATPQATPAANDKISRANALRKEHPDWTKQQIIDAVNQEK